MRISDWSSDVCSSDLFLQKTVHVLPRFGDKKRAVEIGRALQIEVSRYLFTITAINVGLGGATAAAMAMLGLPDPLLWGVLAAILNFIPYAGPILTVGAILLASLVTFSTPVAVFMPPLAFRSEEHTSELQSLM